ncbi:xylanase inhibitor [Hordeum vulgare]|uniref:GH18 domain-containing protein n=1 Tax=Hordeum vulgare subsp. vulgare TaxID=112509 RepID=A0A8I6WR46_HORVV|nr:xylanase inhibitor protein 1-like [Hordeum vulgare subsp. vulgare]KAE8769934.1 xylanase inhibitor [Hordeum vulgare]
MALVRGRPASFLLLVTILCSATFLAVPAAATGKTGQVAVFWGRNKNEGSLREACDTGTYTIAIISFLDVFGRGYYHLDLSGHDVSAVGADIKHCQSKNILVFLSIGGFGKQYSLPTAHSAADVAYYLWNAYMLGTSKGVYRPFGDAFVDGIDFFIENGAPDNYDELAKRLWNFNEDFRGRTPVQLTATPRCGYPDRHVERALATGLVGRIFVRFYDDADCAANWQRQWDKWTAAYPSAQIYLGLPASEQKVGYVHPKNLYYGVIQVVQKAANYGGVMVWERYEDKRTNYSSYAIQWA